MREKWLESVDWEQLRMQAGEMWVDNTFSRARTLLCSRMALETRPGSRDQTAERVSMDDDLNNAVWFTEVPNYCLIMSRFHHTSFSGPKSPKTPIF